MESGGKPRILVVDDELPFRQVVVDILEPYGLTVRHAADAPEALGTVRSWKPDLLLVDVMMPGGCGLALVKRLRAEAKWHRLPVIIVSALAGKSDREAGVQAGASAYLTKPFSASDLRQVLRQFVPVVGTAELQGIQMVARGDGR